MSGIPVRRVRFRESSRFAPAGGCYVHGGYRYRSPFREYSDPDYIDVVQVDDVPDQGYEVASRK